MKKYLFLLPLFLLAGSLSASAQQATLRDSVIGLWQQQVESDEFDGDVKITLHLKADSSVLTKVLAEVEELDGAVRFAMNGTWLAQGDSIVLDMDPASINMEYFGDNTEVRTLFQSMGPKLGADLQQKNPNFAHQVLHVRTLTDDALTVSSAGQKLNILGGGADCEKAEDEESVQTYHRVLVK